ncbi:MAG: stage V sporulation protein AD [Oscillospiraceae bacterium]|nr:stage V sporulation protein AD [Oscillospiraceae bacterium]
MSKQIGRQTITFPSKPTITASACMVGKRESAGPLGHTFDYASDDTTFGEKTWEKSEARMQKDTLQYLCNKSKLTLENIDLICAGDLLDQCVGSSFGLRESSLPFLGLYGACSTMAEGLLVASMAVDGQYAQNAVAMTSSHFCTAERQYRMPLEYGGQRLPTAQWTVTGAGGCVISAQTAENLPRISQALIGKIVDCGITDAGHMGGAMAPAAYESIIAFWQDTDTKPSDYDLILTGDLGIVGKSILEDLLKTDGYDLGDRLQDCGAMIYDINTQDVHAGGSGCGCSAVVLCGHVLERMRAKVWKKILFCGTGALLSPLSVMQGESIPGICHIVCIEV